jgi:hypothetical protein
LIPTSKIAFWLGCVLAFAVWLGAGRALAEEATNQAAARSHFKRGLVLAQKGELADAVTAFEDAYRTSPHFQVLYNLGQAYAAIGRSPEAVKTLERYLSEGDTRIPPHRREAVADLVRQQRARLGRIEIELSPSGSELIVDGTSLGSGPFEPLELTSGKHVVAARSERHRPDAETIDVRPGTTERVTLKLVPDAPPASEPVGQVFVHCKVPGVRVVVDASVKGVTPLEAPLVLPTRSLSFAFERDGYRPFSTTVQLKDAEVRKVECNVVPDGATPREKSGSLQIHSSEQGANVLLDERPYKGELVPYGPHTLLVQKDGYRPHRQTILVTGGRRRTLSVLLEPTPARRQSMERERRTRLTWAAGLGLGGAALGGASGITYAWNAGRYRDWQADVSDYEADLAQGGGGADAVARGGALRERATSIQRADDVALAMALGATSMIVTAAVLWLTTPD